MSMALYECNIGCPALLHSNRKKIKITHYPIGYCYQEIRKSIATSHISASYVSTHTHATKKNIYSRLQSINMKE